MTGDGGNGVSTAAVSRAEARDARSLVDSNSRDPRREHAVLATSLALLAW